MDKKKEYLIGDVSRIVGLSRDALRARPFLPLFCFRAGIFPAVFY